tara:strand:- start:5177 stop:5659 length:483 start_codon:yes stop_codon:yes gene_type:complete
MNAQKFKQGILSDKSKRGWWFSVVFMIIVVGLILFLTYVKIVDENRDVLVGILGMITGSISSMMAIASGRDPSEVEELKDKLSSSDADRAALIGRLRDCQIQLQLKNEQVFELQNAVINKLSVFHDSHPITTKDESQVTLNPHIEEWLPVDRQKQIKNKS